MIQQRWDDWDKLEQRRSKTQKRQIEEGLQAARWRRSARVEWALMAWHRSSSRREGGAACSGWDSRTWCVPGSWNEGPSRDWAWWSLDGLVAGRPRREEGEWGEGAIACHHHHVWFRICWCISAFCLLEKGCWRTSALCTHLHEFLYISNLFLFIDFIVISNIWFCINDVIIGRHTWNCQICTHIHTGYTHTQGECGVCVWVLPVQNAELEKKVGTRLRQWADEGTTVLSLPFSQIDLKKLFYLSFSTKI